MNSTVNRILLIFTRVSVVICILLWILTIAGWIVTDLSFESVNTLIGAILSTLTSALGWLGWSRKTENLTIQPIRPVSLKNLSSDLTKGGKVKWVNREPDAIDLLLREQRILIIGEEGIGKRREGVEMIRYLSRNDNSYVHPHHIYQLDKTLRLWDPIQIEGLLRQQIVTQKPLVLFIDKLPQLVPKTSLNTLTTCLEVLDEHNNAFIIATALDSHLTPVHHNWFKENGFKMIHLDPFTEPHLQQFLDNAIHEYDVDLSKDAVNHFLTKGKGNPNLMLMALRHLPKNKLITHEQAVEVLESSLIRTWFRNRKKLFKQYPPARYLIHALSVFSAEGLDTYTTLVIPFATSLWKRQSRHWLPEWIRVLILQRILQQLSEYEIVAHDHVIRFSAYIVEPEVTTPTYINYLEDFLLGYRASYRLPVLDLPYQHTTTLQAYSLLLIGTTKRNNPDMAIRFYDKALQLTSNKKLASHIYTWRASLKFGVDNPLDNIENTLLRQTILSVQAATQFQLGKPQESIMGIGKALDSTSLLDNQVISGLRFLKASAHNASGEVDQAIKEYDKAIALDPTNLFAYYYRAIAHNNQNHSQQALVDLQSTLMLNPNFADAIMLQTILLTTAGQYEDALKSITRLFTLKESNHWLESDNSYVIKSHIHNQLGEFESAINEITSALSLQHNANYLFLRGSLYAKIQSRDAALSDFKTAGSMTNSKKLAQMCDFAITNIDLMMLSEFEELEKEYLRRGMYDWRSADFARAITQNSNDTVIYYGWSLFHLRNERPELSLEYVNCAIDLESDSHELFHMRAFLTLQVGSPMKWSTYDWDTALAISPNKSIKYIVNSIKRNPNFASSHGLSHELSSAQKSLITTMEAFKDWDKAIAFSPNEIVASYYSKHKKKLQVSLEQWESESASTGASMLVDRIGVDQVNYVSHILDKAQQRLYHLVSLKEQGTLSEAEQLELDEWQQIEHVMSIYKTQLENR